MGESMPVRYEAPGAFDQVFQRVQVQTGRKWCRPMRIVVRFPGRKRPVCTYEGVLVREVDGQ